MLVDGLARELVVSRNRLSIHRFARDARDGERAVLSDRLDIARSASDLLGHFRLQVGHDLFGQLQIVVDVLPAANVAPDLLGKKISSRRASTSGIEYGKAPLVQPKIHNVHVLAGQPAELEYLIDASC